MPVEGPQKGGSRQVVVSHAAKENRINVYIQKKHNGYIIHITTELLATPAEATLLHWYLLNNGVYKISTESIKHRLDVKQFGTGIMIWVSLPRDV